MHKQKLSRNMAVVLLRKADPKVFTFDELAQLFEVQKHVVHKVFLRDKDKYNLPNESLVNSKV